MNILIAQSQSQQLAAVITSSVNFGNLWKTAASFFVRNHLSEVVLVQWVQKSLGCDGRKSHRGRCIPRYISAFSVYKDNIPLLSWRQEGARISMTILYPAQNINQHAAEWKPNPEAFSFVLFFPCASRPLSGAQLSLCWERAVNAANALGSPGSPSQQQGNWAGRLAHTCDLWWYRSCSLLCMFSLCDFRHNDGPWGCRKNLIFKILAGMDSKFPPVTIPWYVKFLLCSPEAFLAQQSSSPPLLSPRVKEFSVSRLKKISCWVTLYPSNTHIDDHIGWLLTAWIPVKERSGLLW